MLTMELVQWVRKGSGKALYLDRYGKILRGYTHHSGGGSRVADATSLFGLTDEQAYDRILENIDDAKQSRESREEDE